MLKVAYPPPRPLSVGEILDLIFRIYLATIVKCLPFAALGVIAGQVPNLFLLARGIGTPQSISQANAQAAVQSYLRLAQDPLLWMVSIASLVLAFAFFGAIMMRQYAMLTDGPRDSQFMAGLRKVPCLVLLWILLGLAFGASLLCILPALLLSGLLRWGLALLLLAPASYVLVALSCATTVLLVTGVPVLESMERSWKLTKGSFWRLSIVYTVALIVISVFKLASAGIAGAVAAVMGRGDLAVFTATITVVSVALGALVTPFSTALGLAVFGDLTVRKEGADLAQRISATA